MDPTSLLTDLQTFWLWAAAPAALVASIAVLARLPSPTRYAAVPMGVGALLFVAPLLIDGVKPLALLGAGLVILGGILLVFFELRRDRPKDQGPGGLKPFGAIALSAVGSYGAASAVGAATAVSLGGAGAVAWVWIFAVLLAPLRMAEVLLARTSPPGAPGKKKKKEAPVPESLAGRLIGDRRSTLQGLGWVLLVLVPIAAFAFFGGAHGEAARDAAARALPHSATWIVLGVAIFGAVLAILPIERMGVVLGWIALLAVLALAGAALVAIASEPARGVAAFGRALIDATRDAPRSGAFAGATVGEIAFAAILYLLPPAAATTGIDGAIHAQASAPTKKQAAYALLGPILYGALTTIVAFSAIATGAFMTRVLDTRPASEVTGYRVGFETVSQRMEESRLFSGLLRIDDGDPGVLRAEMATERGMIESHFTDPSEKTPPTEETTGRPDKRLMYAFWFDRGEPADILLRFEDGRPVELQSRGSVGALERRDLVDLNEVTIRGEMLPRGVRLFELGIERGSNRIVALIAIGLLLLLASLGAAAWGIGVARTLRAKVPEKIARFTAVIPALGLAVAAFDVIPSFAILGGFFAGLLVIATSIALIWRAREVGQLAE